MSGQSLDGRRITVDYAAPRDPSSAGGRGGRGGARGGSRGGFGKF